MRHSLLISIAMIAMLFASCGNKSTEIANSEGVEVNIHNEEPDSLLEEEEEEDFVPLNNIRFDDWDEEDWWDNDYIRAFRTYVDDFNAGKVEDETLSAYRDVTKSKFIVGAIEPCVFGGVMMKIIFFDAPEKLFSAWVYGIVDEDKKIVTDYEVRFFEYKGNIEMTKDDILKMLKTDSRVKLW